MFGPSKPISLCLLVACMGGLVAAWVWFPTRPLPVPLAEQLVTVRRTLDRIWDRYRAKSDQVKDDAELNRLGTDAQRDLRPIVRHALDLAELHPDDPVAFEALLLVVTTPIRCPEELDQAYRMLGSRYANDERLGPACRYAHSEANFTQSALDFLQTVLSENPDRRLRGIACYYLADLALRVVDYIPIFQDPQHGPAEKEKLKDSAVLLRRAERDDPDRLTAEAVALLERVDREFGDVMNPEQGGVTIGKLARERLFVQVGRPAPETSGEDIDGVRFRLRDYRGKVVLFSFWGHW